MITALSRTGSLILVLPLRKQRIAGLHERRVETLGRGLRLQLGGGVRVAEHREEYAVAGVPLYFL
ncbi:MAG: hypothetical protein BJ554DRAFT_4610 [Olpidium bornovanus]|uniref:Uncharacterized protein n=1 Tax=Olpidium bornovanus TaxID=278681 RepID=A0A8H8A040_9FUNG|nr:MAG: hypothetical protein BJ554DRAFT_4610 [Olpidium bornovanus]